ncbi:MAG: hydrogenase small subunit [Thermodesulfobacteriota bacterium]
MQHKDFEKVKESLGGISRRDFIKFCSVIAAGMSLPLSAGKDIAHAVTNPKRPPVIWLSGQGCTGCTESLLRPSTHFTLENLLLNLISLEYNETLNAGAGHQAESHKEDMVEKYSGKFVLVVEGAVPTKDGGIYCQIAGKPFQKILKETAEKAGAIIAIGSCASWGGLVSSDPNPTGAKGAPEVLKGKTVVTIPGCPPNAYNFLSTVAYFITYDKLPAIDQKGRPKFAYHRLIHENCERRPHFDAGRFAEEFGDEGHQKGYCLYKLGCKGPVTYNNCSIKNFNDVSTWPVNTGHPCFGCSEENVGFDIPKFQEAELKEDSIITPSATPADIHYDQGSSFSAGAAALAGAAVGAAAGAGAVTVKHMKSNSNEDDE